MRKLDWDGGLTLEFVGSRLTFSTEQVARLCGVTRRQLTYWVQRGFVPQEDGFTVAAVEKVLLIKRALDEGATLRTAVREADRLLNERTQRRAQVMAMSAQQLRAAVDERLDQLEEALRRFRGTLPVQASASSLQKIWERLDGLNLEELLSQPEKASALQERLLKLDDAVDELGRTLQELQQAA
jgi:DNA-binding transcriptional MerR regulator